MSRASVRAAIVEFFGSSDAGIEGLNGVHRAPPRVIDGGELVAYGSASGAVGLVHIAQHSEHRIAIGGAFSGVKYRTYTCWLYLLYRSKETDYELATDSHDTLMDQVLARLQSDRTLGGAVYQAGEGGSSAGNDVRVTTGLPVRINNEYHIWSGVEFDVDEPIQT